MFPTSTCLPKLVVSFSVRGTFLVGIGSMLSDNSVSVVLQRTEVVRNSGCLSLPVIALGSLLLDLGGNGLGQKVVLVLSIIISQGANDGLLHQVLPATLFSKVDGFLSITEIQGSITSHSVSGGIPSHERVLPSLRDGSIIIEANLPDLFRIQRRLVRTSTHLLDDNHAHTPVRHVLGGQMGRIQSGDFGSIFRKDRISEFISRVVDHQGILVSHIFHSLF
mmetsp:Transcript_18796/g.46578  ORF Transcript_18796/g.46578 Transcript_18796/m.46578 type:complete len:221 (-) Transcript_18796:257-919(-)